VPTDRRDEPRDTVEIERVAVEE